MATWQVRIRLSRYEKEGMPRIEEEDPDAPAPASSGGGGGTLLGSALHGGDILGDDGSSSPPKPSNEPPIRSAQWKLYYSTMVAGSLGYEAAGAMVPYTDAPCEFATPGRASSYSYGSRSDDKEAKLETRHVVIEWQAAAFAGRGHYERAKIEADEAENGPFDCILCPGGFAPDYMRRSPHMLSAIATFSIPFCATAARSCLA